MIDTSKPHPARMTAAADSSGVKSAVACDGLELVEPGVSVVHHWHPEPGESVPGQDDGVIPGYGAVARKP